MDEGSSEQITTGKKKYWKTTEGQCYHWLNSKAFGNLPIIEKEEQEKPKKSIDSDNYFLVGSIAPVRVRASAVFDDLILLFVLFYQIVELASIVYAL